MLTKFVLAAALSICSISLAQVATIDSTTTDLGVAASTAIEGSVRIKAGWVVSYVQNEFDPNEPTLVLLPGIYRGYEKSEAFIQDLESRRVNYVAIHFSSHLRSIKALAKDEQPVFAKGKNVTPQSLAAEVEAVVDDLKIKKPIVVSLSYSALVMIHLNSKKFPYAIETAPMGVYNETNLMGSYYGKWWADWIMATNVNGKEIVEKAKDQAFYTYWTSVVSGLSTKYKEYLDPTVSKNQIDGFVGLARASEGFDITVQDFKKGPKRTWIFGVSEDFTRSRYQKKAVELYLATLDQKTADQSILGKKGVVTIENAGHIVPVENPTAYVGALLNVIDSLKSEGRY